MGSNTDLPAAPRLFATYEPRPSDVARQVLEELIIRPSVLTDRDALAEIAWRRNGGTLSDYLARFERDLTNLGNALDAYWATAVVEDRPVGYGKIAWFEP